MAVHILVTIVQLASVCFGST